MGRIRARAPDGCRFQKMLSSVKTGGSGKNGTVPERPF